MRGASTHRVSPSQTCARNGLHSGKECTQVVKNRIVIGKAIECGYAARDGRDRVDPVTLIVTALAAGASAGALDALKDATKGAAKVAYGKLHDLVKKLLHGNTSAEIILAEHQADPKAFEAGLAKKLTEAGAADDDALVAAAEAFMELVDQTGAKSGKYKVTIKDSKGVQVGDRNIQYNAF